MILATLVAAGAVAGPGPIGLKEWDSLNHDFVCDLHGAQGQKIRLEGSAREKVKEVDRRVETEGEFLFRSPDGNWRFLAGATKTAGGGLLGSHSLHFDNIDDPSKPGFKPYSLQLTFANRIDRVEGPYGFAVIRDQSVDKARVEEGSDHPITAIGICQMTPKPGAIG